MMQKARVLLALWDKIIETVMPQQLAHEKSGLSSLNVQNERCVDNPKIAEIIFLCTECPKSFDKKLKITLTHV